jgi:hypothetical protein
MKTMSGRVSEQFARGNWLAFALGGVFWLIFLTMMIAAVRANYLMVIACGPKVCRYRLPHVSAWDFLRRPFALRTGEISYSMIEGVEKRRETIRRGRSNCSAVCLAVRDQPLRTFVRSGVSDHEWVEAFARDIAARARFPGRPRDGPIHVCALALKENTRSIFLQRAGTTKKLGSHHRPCCSACQ